MARRKRGFIDDSDDDSSGSDSGGSDGFEGTNDPDLRAEQDRFKDPYGRKRRRGGGARKAFGDDSDDEEEDNTKKAGRRKHDWAKAPAFVSGAAKVDLKEDVDSEDEDEDEDGEEDAVDAALDEDEDVMDTGSDDNSRPASPRVHLPEDDDDDDNEAEREMAATAAPKPRIGGIGFSKSTVSGGSGGIGFSKATSSGSGLGFSAATSTTQETTPTATPPPSSSRASPMPSALPTAFGTSRQSSSSRGPQTHFKRAPSPPTAVNRPAAPLTREDSAAFAKMSGSFGARMLSKMGWSAGTGLGSTGEGIITPVESKLRPSKTGIAFKGFKERTSQSVREARRKGEDVSGDEDEEGAPRTRKGKGAATQAKEKAWKRPPKKAAKVRIEHKTYEQILADTAAEGSGTPAVSGVGQIIDATGATPREVSSLSEVAWDSPSADPTRLPELRHNLRLIVEGAKTDLDGLAREGTKIQERRKEIEREEMRLSQMVRAEAELIARLQQVHLIADEIQSVASELSSSYDASLSQFTPIFTKLSTSFASKTDIQRFGLDALVVGAISPLFRRLMSSWAPLSDPLKFVSELAEWKVLLPTNPPPQPTTQLSLYGGNTISTGPAPLQTMTPYESLLWTNLLPKIRSVVNDPTQFTPASPGPFLSLLEAWIPLLPQFMIDNILDQLVLPKLNSFVSDWRAPKSTAAASSSNTNAVTPQLSTAIHPWLPLLGPLRSQPLLETCKRKLKSTLRSWTPPAPPPSDLTSWKPLYTSKDWSDLLLGSVVPKLGAYLRESFSVNPRAQDLAPLHAILLWSSSDEKDSLLPHSILNRLLESELMPKWLSTLHIWLTAPGANYGQVADWYTFWSGDGVFPAWVRELSGVKGGFARGRELMDQALRLGKDRIGELAKPTPISTSASTSGGATGTKKAVPTKKREEERTVTFRQIVEEEAAAHNLLVLPAGRVHPLSRMPLLRVSKTADGRGGVLVYLEDDAVWAAPEEGGEVWRALGLKDMVVRALKG